MNALPQGMPAALTQEKQATNLAALVMSEPFNEFASTLLAQWSQLEAFEPLRKHGIHPINLALFYGPPGNGKTVSAQLIASKLGCPLYRVQCESLLGKYLGDTVKNVAAVMDWLAQQDLCVVLWDEAEAIFPSRERSQGSSCEAEVTNAMTVFWQRLDRWDSAQLFLLATNMHERLDPALLSRISLQLEFGPPTREQAHDVLTYWSEVLHQHGSADWSAAIAADIRRRAPVSFRELWQSIAQAVRLHIAQATDGD